ncbi:MAG: chromosome segregation protein SMC [Candidatus Kapabacteria bacterium]|nr:chromosome segregation protein SMC [Candidatus Kapabacteria bacterium]
MYLSDLEIFGFKSFAQKTKFKFSDGLSAVVGPNGCGKTNVVDAIRWVLGEQKTSILRSDLMENVIFNGTATRKPLGMAEVTITIENNKQILPIEYQEVSISRRLFRNGESKYYLNKTQCRLRDILDLFMDTGMGPDSYSVIELKMVEAILSGKPEERRHLIEEAAGVNRFKVRKKEADKKLISVHDDLERIEDVVREIQKNVNSLARQAAKTRRYNEFQSQLRAEELELFHHDAYLLNKKINTLDSEIKDITNNKTQLDINVSSHEQQLIVIKEKINVLDTQFKSAKENESQLKYQISTSDQKLAVLKEKKLSTQNFIERNNREIESSESAVQAITNQILNSHEHLRNLRIELEDANRTSSAQKETYNLCSSSVSKAREQVAILSNEVYKIEAKNNSQVSRLRSIEQRKTSLGQRISNAYEDKTKIIDDIKITEKTLENSNIDLETIKSQLENSEHTLALAQENQRLLQSKTEELRQNLSSINNETGKKKAALDFLEGLTDSAVSSKFLLDSKNWLHGKDKLMLAEVVGTDDNYRLAVEAALGEAGKYFITDNFEDAALAASLLVNSNRGKASFICKDNIPAADAPNENLNIQGVFGFVSEIVRVEPQLRNALRILLGTSVIAENIEIARNIVDSNLVDTAVTLSGELYRRGGIYRGGSHSREEGAMVGKRERINVIKQELSQLASEYKMIEAEYNETRSELNSIEIPKLTSLVKNNENSLKSIEKKILELTYKKESIEKKISVLEENISNFSDEHVAVEAEFESISKELESGKIALAQAHESYLNLFEDTKELEKDLNIQNEKLKVSELNVVRKDSEIKSIEREIQNLSHRIDDNNRRKKELFNENENNISKTRGFDNESESLNIHLATLREQFSSAANSSDFLAESLSGEKEQFENTSNALNLLRKEHDKISANLMSKEIEFTHLSDQFENLKEKIIEHYTVDFQIDNFAPNADFNFEQTKFKVNDLKSKLTALGSVNFIALEEFEEQNQRLMFYNKQLADLHEAKKNLQETIDEINQTAQSKFITVFKEISDNFVKLFKLLFGNDAEGYLQLSDGDPLEADIGIIAKPAGKRPHSIEMLSGGEKTLCAIALLFSIYLVKPSPFCILDEVDAPLDDLNIDKYINLIKEFSRNTQFLIVTHNKRTMEAADNLYGITQAEEGVSKVVSVRLTQSLAS